MPLFASQVDRQFRRFCRTGDAKALGTVFDRTAAELLRVACYLTRNRADAEDLVQRTFLAAIEGRASFVPNARAVPWLLGILANLARQLHRERGRAAPVRSEPTADPVARVAERELHERLAALRSDLGAPYADVLQLHLEQGLNAKEIAAALSRPPGTVRTQLMRGLQVLRQRLPDGFLAGGGLLLLGRPSAAAATNLAAIRQVVVQSAARTTAPFAVAVPVLVTGAWFVKKIAAATTLLAVLVGGWFAWPAPDEVPPPSPRSTSTAPAAAALAPPPATIAPAAEAAPVRAEAVPTIAADPGFATVRVRVRWQHDGSPAAGVGLWASNGRAVARRDAVSEHDGTATLPHLRPGTWQFWSALGEAPVERALRADAIEEVHLVAVRRALASGRVVDPAGRPVAGARIWVSLPGDSSHGHEVATSGADGSFVVPIASAHYVGARLAGWTPSHTFLVDAEGEQPPLELRLQHAGGTVAGVVLDDQGTSVPFAKVLIGEQIQRPLDSLTNRNGAMFPRGVEVAADADGRFAVEGVPEGRVPARAWAPGHAPFAGTVDVPANARIEQCFVLPRGAVVTGTIRTASGAPAAGAVVRWGRDDDFANRETTADADGSYSLDDLPPESVELVADWRGVRKKERFVLASGSTTRWDLVLTPGLTIAGRVLGPDGAPRAGVTVLRSDGTGDREVQTDAEGRFTIPECSNVATLRVIDDMQVLLRAEDVQPGAADVVLRLTTANVPSAFVTGRVVDEQGRPVAVALLPWHPDSHMALHWRSHATTGVFAIGPLRPGHYRLDAEGERHGRLPVAEFELAPEQTVELGDLVLRAPGAAEFRVTVQGRPLPGGLLFLRRPDGSWAETLIVEQGMARHAALPPGCLYATAESDGLVQNAEVVIAAGTTARAHLELLPAHRATVTLRDPLGRTRDQLDPQLRAAREDGSFAGLFGAMHLPDGIQFAAEMPAGRYTLRVTTADGRTAAGAVDLRAGHAEVTIALPPAK